MACSGCGSTKRKSTQVAKVVSSPEVGTAGFSFLEYTGKDVKTEYGPITGARYPFWDRNPRYVDSRDAAIMIASQPGDFRYV